MMDLEARSTRDFSSKFKNEHLKLVRKKALECFFFEVIFFSRRGLTTSQIQEHVWRRNL